MNAQDTITNLAKVCIPGSVGGFYMVIIKYCPFCGQPLDEPIEVNLS